VKNTFSNTSIAATQKDTNNYTNNDTHQCVSIQL
jgi:hypothetical protein